MKAINFILALLVSALIGLVVFEGGLRLIGMGPKKSLNEPHEKLGWFKKADETITRRTSEGFKVTYALNEHGMRDDEVSEAKPAGIFRVVCLGDSFTLGYTVEREDLFVDILENWWNTEGRKVEVLNIGTEGWSTDQQAAWLLEYGKTFQPDLVLVFPYENDIYWNAQREYYGTSKPVFGPKGELATATLEAPDDKGFLASTAIGNLFASKPTPDTFQPEGAQGPILKEWAPLLTSPPDFLAEAVAATGGAFQAMRQQADALGCALVVAPIPSHSAVDPAFGANKFAPRVLAGMSADKWSADRPVDIMLERAHAAGLRTLDSRTFLRERFTANGEDLYFNVDWHLNPAGNLAFAEFLHGNLNTLDVLPGTSQPVAAASLPKPEAKGGLPTWAYWFCGLWAFLGISFATFYREEENPALGFLKVGALLSVIFTIAIGGTGVLGMLPPLASQIALILVILVILGFVLYKLGDRVGTITELMAAFVGRGHWYLMPLVVVLLTVGSLLVVAASSPLVAPFIYTLF